MLNTEQLEADLARLSDEMKSLEAQNADKLPADWHPDHAAQFATLADQAIVTETLLNKAKAESGNRPGRKTTPAAPDLKKPFVGDVAAPRGRKYSDLFGSAPQFEGEGSWESAEEFWNALHNGLNDSRIQSASVFQGFGGEGAYVIPAPLVAWAFDMALENEIVRPRADVVPMITNNLSYSGWNTENHTGGNIGGFTAEWLSESEQFSNQAPTMRKVALQAKKLGLYVPVSNELADDGISVDQQLSGALIQALSWSMDDAFVTGTGAGKPRGIINDEAIITVAKESGQAADTILYANLTKMFARLHPAMVSNSVWIINSTAIPQLLSLSVAFASNDEFVPALVQDGSGNFTLLTRPVIFTEKLPTLGDKGDIILANLSQYVVGLRREMSVARSFDAGFQKDEVHYRAKMRADGQGKWSGPITPKNGNTLSWCVTLAERA